MQSDVKPLLLIVYKLIFFDTQNFNNCHCSGLIMSMMVSQITGVLIVSPTVCSDADQRKHQSFRSLAFVRGIHWWLVNHPHKGPEMWKMFPFDNIIMVLWIRHSRPFNRAAMIHLSIHFVCEHDLTIHIRFFAYIRIQIQMNAFFSWKFKIQIQVVYNSISPCRAWGCLEYEEFWKERNVYY